MMWIALACLLAPTAIIWAVLAWCVVRDRRDARAAAMRRDNIVGGVR